MYQDMPGPGRFRILFKLEIESWIIKVHKSEQKHFLLHLLIYTQIVSIRVIHVKQSMKKGLPTLLTPK